MLSNYRDTLTYIKQAVKSDKYVVMPNQINFSFVRQYFIASILLDFAIKNCYTDGNVEKEKKKVISFQLSMILQARIILSFKRLFKIKQNTLNFFR